MNTATLEDSGRNLELCWPLAYGPPDPDAMYVISNVLGNVTSKMIPVP